jgi:hypothetical protein
MKISDEIKEMCKDRIKSHPKLNPIYETIKKNREEDKSIQLWVYFSRTKDNLYSEEKNDEEEDWIEVDGDDSWFEIYSFLFEDETGQEKSTDRTKKVQKYFLLGLLEITIYDKNWIENTVLNNDYFQFPKKINQIKNNFLSKDQFIFGEHLNYSMGSMLRWQNYLIYKEKIFRDIKSFQNISENQKRVLKVFIFKDKGITDIESFINNTIDDTFSKEQQQFLKKNIKKGVTAGLARRYIRSLKQKVDNWEINILDQLLTFTTENETLIFTDQIQFFIGKPISKKQLKVFVNSELFSNYYDRKVDNAVEKKFFDDQAKLKTINFVQGHGKTQASIANMITWINYLNSMSNAVSSPTPTTKDQSGQITTSVHRETNKMNDETSLYKYEKKKRDEARADKTIITESIKKILAKIRLKSYTGLTEEEKHIIDEGIKESPKILWEFEAADLAFCKKKIAENYYKRKSFREAAKEKALKEIPQKEESLWESSFKKLKNLVDQITIPQAAVSLVTAGISAVIFYNVYSFNPGNINLTVPAKIPVRAGSQEIKEFTLQNGGELESNGKFRIEANIDKNAFIYVISRNSSGNISLLNEDPITAVNNLILPPGKDQWFTLDSKRGQEAIYLIASKRKIKDIEARVEKLKETGIDNIDKIFKKAKIEPFKFNHN